MKKWVYVLLALLCAGLILLGGGLLQQRGKAASLRDELQELNAAVASERSALKAEAAESGEALAAAKAENESLTAALAEAQAALTEKETALTEKETALTETEAALTEKEAALTEAETALAALPAAGELEALTAALSEKEAALSEKEAALERLTAELEEKSAALESLSAASAAESESLREALQGREAEIAALHDDAAGQLSEIEMLTAALRGKSEELEALSADVAGKDAQITALSVPPVSEWDAEALAAVTEGESRNTKRFLLRLQEEGVPCAVESTDEGEVLRFERALETAGGELRYTLEAVFGEGNDSAVLRVPELIDYRSEDRYCVYYICDKVNSAWRWVKLFTATDDSVVTAEYDCVLADSPVAGDSVWAAVEKLDKVLSEAYELLLPYRK